MTATPEPRPDTARGTLVEFAGLPGTGKSTLARQLALRTGAVLLRIDEIEAALRRNNLTAEQTGVASYSVAHDLAASHLSRGLIVIADAVNPVEAARAGWRELARDCGARHRVIETQCPDNAEHRRRVEQRAAAHPTAGHSAATPGWSPPTWPGVEKRAAEYQPRTDERLIVDTTSPLATSHRLVAEYLGL